MADKKKQLADGYGSALEIEGGPGDLPLKSIKGGDETQREIDMTDIDDAGMVKLPDVVKDWENMTFVLGNRIGDRAALPSGNVKFTVKGPVCVDGTKRPSFEFYGFISKRGGLDFEQGTRPQNEITVVIGNYNATDGTITYPVLSDLDVGS